MTSCGMLQEEIKAVGGAIMRSGSICGLHLCLNPGLSEEVVEFLRVRCHCKPHEEKVKLAPF